MRTSMIWNLPTSLAPSHSWQCLALLFYPLETSFNSSKAILLTSGLLYLQLPLFEVLFLTSTPFSSCHGQTWEHYFLGRSSLLSPNQIRASEYMLTWCPLETSIDFISAYSINIFPVKYEVSWGQVLCAEFIVFSVLAQYLSYDFLQNICVLKQRRKHFLKLR